MSSEAAEPILRDLGFAEDEIKDVGHAIVAHSYSAGVPPETQEARILRDADRLDALGAIGIARVFAVSGALDRALYDPDDPFAENRDLDEAAFALDHWQTKLLKLPQDMATPVGARLARERVAVMRAYLAQFADDVDVPLPANWRDG